MSDRDELEEMLIIEFGFKKDDLVFHKLVRMLNRYIDQVSTRRAAEAQLEILRGFRRRDFTLDSFYEAAVIDQIARLQPTKGSK